MYKKLIRPHTTDSKNNNRNQSHHQLWNALFDQINNYQDPPPERAMSQQRSRNVPTLAPTFNQSYDPTETIFQRLYPQRPYDPKLAFIKVREKALKRSINQNTRKRCFDESKFTIAPPIKYNKEIKTEDKIQKSKILENSFRKTDYTKNMLKQMQRDKEKLVQCSFNY